MNDRATPDNRFAPPRAEVADLPAAPDEPELGSRGARLGAAVIDALIALSIYLAVMVPMYGIGQFKAQPGDGIRHLPGTVLYLVLAYAMQAWFLHRSSQSVGKLALGLRIVRQDGRRAGFVRSFWLRLVAAGAVVFIPYVGMLVSVVDCLFIFGSSRRCLHDYLADTVVVTAASSGQLAPAAFPA